VSSAKRPKDGVESAAEPTFNYRATNFAAIGITASRDQLYKPENRALLDRMVAHAISIEAPMFEDVLARRIARVHGLARATSKLIEIIQEITEGKFERTHEDDRVIIWPERAEVSKLVPFRPGSLEVRDHVDIPLIELASLASPLLANDHAPGAPAVIMGRELGLGSLHKRARARFVMAAELARQYA
jgi:Protein of unknown function (DUF3320)